MLYKNMANVHASLTSLSDAQLLVEVKRLAAREREATAELIRALTELDARRLYLAQGFSSLFCYCTQALHLSEHAALGRIEAARAARRFPVILERLLDGSVTVTNVRLLASHLTAENHVTLLESARHKSKRDVEQIVAGIRPLPDVAASVRRLPERAAASSVIATPVRSETAGSAGVEAPASASPPATLSKPPSQRSLVAPLAPGRYRVQFTVSRETHDKLRRAQDLLRHTVPSGDPAAIFDRALTLLVEQLEKARFAATSRPRPAAEAKPGSRQIPAAVRREVWARDGDRCAFIGSRGRCAERGFLEFHHVVPYAAGGRANAENIQLRCRAHNAFEAELFFGAEVVRERMPAWG